MERVSPTSLLVLHAIVKLYQRDGWMPTVEEIADEVGFASKSTAYKHLQRLERLGLVDFKQPHRRVYRITELGHAVLCEMVAA
jgi:SOS-response transcriptional repressor LexA